jgi:hypothetical protein
LSTPGEDVNIDLYERRDKQPFVPYLRQGRACPNYPSSVLEMFIFPLGIVKDSRYVKKFLNSDFKKNRQTKAGAGRKRKKRYGHTFLKNYIKR